MESLTLGQKIEERIGRSSIAESEHVADVFREECRRMLNYEPRNEAGVALDRLSKVHRVLRSLNLAPLKAEGVEDYMDKALTKANRICFEVTAVLSVAGAVGILVFVAFILHAEGSIVWSVLCATVLSLMAMAVAGGLCALALQELGISRDLEWKSVHISQYGGSIPKRVLSLALEVQEALKAAGLREEWSWHVVAMTDRKAVPDPFLVLRETHGSAELYMAAWDEDEYVVEYDLSDV